MIAVDFQIVDHRLNEFHLTGECGVIPESSSTTVLESIHQAMNGSPGDISASAYASRIRAALPIDAELVGTSPHEIGKAICQGIREHGPASPVERIGQFDLPTIDRLTEKWKSASWQIISETALPPEMNVALDEVLLQEAIAGRRMPTLRFWAWTRPAVVLGRSQSADGEIDLGHAASAGIAIVRRMTGGGTMFVQPEGTIAYSLCLPESLLAGLSIRQSYEVCDAWLVRALREMGFEAHHVPINDIASPDGKIGGAAQCRRGGWILHHTALAYSMDDAAMRRILRVGRNDSDERKGVRSASKRVSPLNAQSKMNRSEIAGRLREGFASRYGGTPATISDGLVEMADERVRTKYGTREWIFEGREG